MKQQSLALQHSIDLLLKEMAPISEEDFSHKATPQKWSKKEILGHLIDSAQNNIQRFVRSQYQPETEILYDQNQWVTINNYQQAEREHLIRLWTSLNQQLITIWEGLSPSSLQTQVSMGDDVRVTLFWLMDDYVAHMQHHGQQMTARLEPEG